MPSTSVGLAQLKERLCHREHLSPEECEKALLPSLEHASMVHSHVHPPTLGLGSNGAISSSPDHHAMTPGAAGAEDTFEQTRNAIIYIGVVVAVYVLVIMWLVSSNFRSAAVNAAKVSKKTASLSRCLTHIGSKFQRLRLLRGDDYYADCAEDDEDDHDDDLECCNAEADECGVFYDDGCGGGLILEDEDEDDDDEFVVDGDTEALLVVQDSKGRKKPRCTTHFEEDYEGEPV